MSRAVRFRSRHFPGDAPAVLVYARHLGRPLLFCATPVMLLALVAMLQHIDPFGFALWGLLGAYVVASGWTYFYLQKTWSEIAVSEDGAAIRSVWDSAWRRPFAWKRVFGLKRTEDGLAVTLGLDPIALRSENWPQFDALTHALEAAYRANQEYVAGQPAPPRSYLRRRARRIFGDDA